MSEQVQTAETVRISATKSNWKAGVNEMMLTGLNNDEMAEVEAFALGLSWARVADGRMHFHSLHEEPPAPSEDCLTAPHWPTTPPDTRFFVRKFINDPDRPSDGDSPSIIIQHLCGYYHTPERYAKIADDLERWGFECLRSRRGRQGRYWEIWYLPGAWASAGELREAVLEADEGKTHGRKAAAAAVDFLRERSSFGTLDLSVQRLAMVID